MHQESSACGHDSDDSQQNPQIPENSAPRKQRDRSNYQAHFQENFCQVKSVGSVSFVADLGLHLVGFIFDLLLLVFVARRLS